MNAKVLLAGCAILAAIGQAGPGVAAGPERDPPPGPRCLDVAVRDDLLVLGQTGGIVTIDVSDPAKPRELGRLGIQATIVRIAIDGDRAWLAAGAHGLLRVDLGDPAAPRLEHRHDVPGKVQQALPLGDRVVIAVGRHGLSVIDVSEPDRPRQRASVGTRDEVRALALHGALLATAEEEAGVRLFDLERPDTPRALAEVDIEGALDVAFVGELLVVAAGRRGTVVIDVSEPKSPRITAEIPAARSAATIAPFGSFVLVGNGGAGIQIIDPTLVESRRALKTVKLSKRYPVGRLAASGTAVFAAADQGGFGVLDLEDIDDPRVLHPRERRIRVEFP